MKDRVDILQHLTTTTGQTEEFDAPRENIDWVTMVALTFQRKTRKPGVDDYGPWMREVTNNRSRGRCKYDDEHPAA